MSPADFDLQPSEVPQPTLLDEEITTKAWPMPAPLGEKPSESSLFWKIVEALW